MIDLDNNTSFQVVRSPLYIQTIALNKAKTKKEYKSRCKRML
jgi:hypothetical protein